MNVGGYNTHLAKPDMQVKTAELTGWLDDYIWMQLADATFNPLEGENRRLLLWQAKGAGKNLHRGFKSHHAKARQAECAFAR